MIRKLLIASVALTALAVAACKPAVKEEPAAPVEPQVEAPVDPTATTGDQPAQTGDQTGQEAGKSDATGGEAGAATADTGAAEAGAAEKK